MILYKMWFKLMTVNLFVYQAFTQYEGEPCIDDKWRSGICTRLYNCTSTKDEYYEFMTRPKTCSFDKKEPIICCIERPSVSMAMTTERISRLTTEEYKNVGYPDYTTLIDEGCEPLSNFFTTEKTGRKSWDKCLEYQEKYVYPCAFNTALIGGMSRVNNCHHNADELIDERKNASRYEFPHMVLLGYGNLTQSAEWGCGGTIISERFILTAGHCTEDANFGMVTYVALDFDVNAKEESRIIYNIDKIIIHPDYQPPSVYNDIALLRTNRHLKLGEFAVPACLNVGHADHSSKDALATSWKHVLHKNGTAVQILQKAVLTMQDNEQCAKQFAVSKNMSEGLKTSQLCYKSKEQHDNTCKGYSGGPLQIKSKAIRCMYVIVGVMSFSAGCGGIQASIFTRLEEFVPWIENIVWP